jgi:DNA-binding CsgD family transcriptional regulator
VRLQARREALAEEILSLVGQGLGPKEIAMRVSVHVKTVRRIIRGKR